MDDVEQPLEGTKQLSPAPARPIEANTQVLGGDVDFNRPAKNAAATLALHEALAKVEADALEEGITNPQEIIRRKQLAIDRMT